MAYRIDAMVGGVEKGGTTSLGTHIAGHPKVLSHLDRDLSPDEIEFSAFVRGTSREDEAFRRGYLDAFGREPREDELVVGKSVGIFHLPDAAQELYRLYPDCKLIFSLRDPVDRAYSAYWYQRFRGTEKAESFEEALSQERKREAEGIWAPHRMYVGKGRYIEHLERLLDLFEREKMHIVLLDDLKQDPEATVNEVFEFLGLSGVRVDGSVVQNPVKRPRWPWLARLMQEESTAKRAFRAVVPGSIRRRVWRLLRRANAAKGGRPPMTEETRARLGQHFRPYNRRLADFLGRDLSAWGN